MKKNFVDQAGQSAPTQTTEATAVAPALEQKELKKRRKRTAVDWLLNILIVVLIGLGLYFFLKPYYIKYQRSKITNQLQTALSEGRIGEKIAYKPGQLLHEAEYDYYEILEDGSAVSVEGQRETKHKETLSYLTPLGSLEIPRLDINTPVIAELDYEAMFYGASYWDESARPGTDGHSVLFMHRTTYSDYYNFVNADKIKEGDEFKITWNGKYYTYKVFSIQEVLPGDLLNHLMNDHQQGKNLSIVTCTPAHLFTYRLIMTAKLVDEQPVSKPTP